MFGSEERHRVCHIIRLAHTAQRDALCHFRLNRFGQDSRHIRCNKAGGYRIDRNAAAGQLPGQALGQTDEACLAGGVWPALPRRATTLLRLMIRPER